MYHQNYILHFSHVFLHYAYVHIYPSHIIWSKARVYSSVLTNQGVFLTWDIQGNVNSIICWSLWDPHTAVYQVKCSVTCLSAVTTRYSLREQFNNGFDWLQQTGSITALKPLGIQLLLFSQGYTIPSNILYVIKG